MAACRYRIRDIDQLSARPIFVDANVLIYLFWPSGSYHLEAQYATIFSRLVKQQSPLYVDFLVISEIINRAHRIEHQKYLAANDLMVKDCSYKKFRDCIEGQQTLSDIYVVVESEILSRFTVVGKSFLKPDIQSFLDTDSLDMIDKAIVSICSDNHLVLLTNDADYKSANIDILSANTQLF